MPTFVFADLAGFAALTEAHGDAAAAGLVREFEALVRRTLPPQTRLVKMIGDAAMIVTDNAGDAIRLAQVLLDNVEALPGRPAVRIGVHTGDAVQRDGDFWGHAVNIAARVAGEARPCEILVTGDALRGIDAALRASITPEPLGDTHLRNVASPVAIYRISGGGDGLVTDPVCRMRLHAGESAASLRHSGKTYSFCSLDCAHTFGEHPEVYAAR